MLSTVTAMAALAGVACAVASAQPAGTVPGASDAAQPTVGQSGQGPGPANDGSLGDAQLSEAQLDQLTAPIALYPDALLGQVLVAATYPLELVEAHRWIEGPGNAALRGAALTAALAQQPWDLSVKSLVPFAQVLGMMDGHLNWTELLGDAFLSQQAAVMDSIQRLRERAAADGSLIATPQQNVATLGGDIDIEPASADVAYVPYYDPSTVYGAWPWPDDPPFAFALPAGIDITLGNTVVGFGPPVPLLPSLWGWPHWNWRRHLLQVGTLAGPGAPRIWQHNPRHRLGVPYRSPALAARYQAQSLAAARRHSLRNLPTLNRRLAHLRGQRGSQSLVAPRLPDRSAGPSVSGRGIAEPSSSWRESGSPGGGAVRRDRDFGQGAGRAANQGSRGERVDGARGGDGRAAPPAPAAPAAPAGPGR